MPCKFLYNLYEGEKSVLENATYADVLEFTGLKSLKISHYIEKNCLICERYRPEKVGEWDKAFAKEKRVQKEQKKYIFTADTYREWKNICSKFQKVIWVKQGGKKLMIGNGR